jgi:hypothetical protein
VINKDRRPFISGLHTIVAKPKTDELAHEYRRNCFQTAAIREQFLFYAMGTKVSGISKANIAELTLRIPSGWQSLPVPADRTLFVPSGHHANLGGDAHDRQSGHQGHARAGKIRISDFQPTPSLNRSPRYKPAWCPRAGGGMNN